MTRSNAETDAIASDSRARSQGAATVLASKPAFAAYGDSANVWGGISNPTGTCDDDANADRSRSLRARDTPR